MSSEALERAVRSGIYAQRHAGESGIIRDALNALDALLAALAVAREREQRLSEALQRIADENYLRGSNDGWEGMCARQGRLARAALVDEPAAATLAEPEQGPRHSARTALDPAACEAPVPASPGSASAEAKWSHCPCGEFWVAVAPSASAAADEPGETP